MGILHFHCGGTKGQGDKIITAPPRNLTPKEKKRLENARHYDRNREYIKAQARERRRRKRETSCPSQ